MRRFGCGPVPAVALHCTLSRGGAWAPVAEHLTHRMRIDAPDLPEHGAMPQWTAGGDYMAATLASLAEPASVPCHVIGHSFGAVAALAFALGAPDRVLSLTLIEPVLFAAAACAETREAILDAHDRLVALYHDDDLEGAARYFTGIWGTGQPWGALPQAARMRIMRQIHIIGDQSPYLHHDAAGLLTSGRMEAFDRPVLLLDGAQSPPVIDDIVSVLAARLPDTRRITIGGAGHMVPLSNPRDVAEAIAQVALAADASGVPA